MIYTNTARPGNGTLLDRLAAIVGRMQQAIDRRRIYERTLRELRALSDRDLADLGLHRADLHEVAREAAYGV